MTTIAFHNLTVSLGGVTPVRDLTAELAGSIIGIVGPNGAGKTTLLNAVSGFVKPVSGDVQLDGTSIVRLRPDRRARLGVGRTFQHTQIPNSITALENVCAGLDHRRQRDSLEAEEALEWCHFDGSPHTVTGELTGLQRRQAELARAIASRPRVVLLDEPTAGMAQDEVTQMRPVLAGIPERIGALVVLVAHDLTLVRSICDHVLALDFGEMLASGDPDSVLGDTRVRAAYLGIDSHE